MAADPVLKRQREAATPSPCRPVRGAPAAAAAAAAVEADEDATQSLLPDAAQQGGPPSPLFDPMDAETQKPDYIGRPAHEEREEAAAIPEQPAQKTPPRVSSRRAVGPGTKSKPAAANRAPTPAKRTLRARTLPVPRHQRG